MNDEEIAAMADQLMGVNENFKPMIEAAEGIRAELIERAWPQSDAQAAATEYLLGLIRFTFNSQMQS